MYPLWVGIMYAAFMRPYEREDPSLAEKKNERTENTKEWWVDCRVFLQNMSLLSVKRARKFTIEYVEREQKGV